MARLQTHYICQACGYDSPKWMGRCPECEAWDSFVEEVSMRGKAESPAKPGKGVSRTVSRELFTGQGGRPIPITEVDTADTERVVTGIGEFDRVLGGGLVPGGVILVGGDPGIGKSTLLTQVAACVASGLNAVTDIASLPAERRVLYVSGEESARQIKLRSARLNAEAPGLLLSVETELELIVRHIEEAQPILAIIDSIQTISDSNLESTPGSVSQVRACAARLVRYARESGVALVLIGHVTKEGNLAGPRVLEHVVDTVLYFEGDRHHAYRMLRAAKNRFGSTDELGIFEMHENGLMGVENPSAALLAERVTDGAGSAVSAALEGSRALLIETQALVARSNLTSPRRAVAGMDLNRVSMILAVLEKRVGLKLAEQDVYINVAGGMMTREPAVDLAAGLAVASSFREQPVRPELIAIGEIGLAGEIRAVSQIEKRLREAARQGFEAAMISRHNARRLAEEPGLKVIPVESVSEALQKGLLPSQSKER